MGKYSVQFSKSTTSTSVGVCSLQAPASSPRRLTISEAILGSSAGTLGTSNFEFDFQRGTTAATGTSLVCPPLDTADAATTAVFQNNLTANGTLTANTVLLTIPLSQQATFRWVANPGNELVIPAAANNGIHLLTPVAGNTPTANGQIFFIE